MGSEAALRLQQAHPLDYTDKWPDVECTIKIKNFGAIDLGEGIFEADFCVVLDWLDFNLKEFIHYGQNVRNGKYFLSMWILGQTNQLFNPGIRVDNAVDDRLQQMDDSDKVPRIETIIRTEEYEGTKIQNVVWLTKTIRYRGQLYLSESSAHWFPLDIQCLPIVVECELLRGMTSLGVPRVLKLTDPSLRYHAGMTSHQFQPGKRIIAHECPRDGEDLGEMTIVGFGGLDVNESSYQVDLILARKAERYAFDFVIQILQVSCAAFSCFVPLNDDCIANRLSITLTVILTLVAFTTQRPMVIDKLPYQTLHDWYEQFMVLLALIVGIENWFVCIKCCGAYGEEADPPHHEYCLEGFLYTSVADSVFLVIFLSGLFMISFGIWFIAQSHRAKRMMLIHQQLHRNDDVALERTNTRLRRSVASPSDSFEAIPHEVCRLLLIPKEEPLKNIYCFSDELDALRTTYTIPGSMLIPEISLIFARYHVRSHLNMLKEGDKRGAAKEKKKQAFIERWGLDSESVSFLNSISPTLQAEIMATFKVDWFKISEPNTQFLTFARQTAAKDLAEHREKDLPQFSSKLNPSRETFIVDVGSREVGFYMYQGDLKTGCVRTEIPDKLELDKTFFTDYVEKANGAKEFATELKNKLGPYILPSFPKAGSGPNFIPTPMRGLSSSSPGHQSSGSFKSTGAGASEEEIDGEPLATKPKIFLGFTGGNKLKLAMEPDAMGKLNVLLRKVETVLQHDFSFCVDLMLYVPTTKLEAQFELQATDWLIQRGDLHVGTDIPTGPRGQEFAGFELQEILASASMQQDGEDIIHASVPFSMLVRSFHNLNLDFGVLRKMFDDCPATAKEKKADVRSVEQLRKHILKIPVVIRALTRHRFFCGTLSAGGGSCQLTFKSKTEHGVTDLHGIPLGNNTPIVGNQAIKGEPPLWPEGQPVSTQGLMEWRQMIKTYLSDHKIPRNLRGFFVGISAVFHASKRAGIDQQILPRDVFLAKMDATIKALPNTGTKRDMRDLSNLILAVEWVRWILNDNAFICAKRNWEVDQEYMGGRKETFVATWSFGFWLHFSQMLGK